MEPIWVGQLRLLPFQVAVALLHVGSILIVLSIYLSYHLKHQIYTCDIWFYSPKESSFKLLRLCPTEYSSTPDINNHYKIWSNYAGWWELLNVFTSLILEISNSFELWFFVKINL